MASGILFESDEVDALRSVLGAAYSYLHAVDLLDSQRAIRSEVKESPLSLAVKELLSAIEDKQGRFELLRRDNRLPEYDADDEGNYLDDEDDDPEDEDDDDDE